MHEYQPPTPEELRAIMRSLDLTGAGAGTLVGVDSRTVRRWLGGDRRMPYQALFTLLNRSHGISITPEHWREEIASPQKVTK